MHPSKNAGEGAAHILGCSCCVAVACICITAYKITVLIITFLAGGPQ
jgi:hypothetical protein